MRSNWTRDSIVRELKSLYRRKTDLSYNAMCRKHQRLLSAAAYHFGSYRRAVIAAKLDYRAILRRPQWTRARIIELIRAGHARGVDLSWSRVSARSDELGRAALATLQPRLFGSWRSALAAARIDRNLVARYQRWTKPTLILALRTRSRKKQPVNSGTIQREIPALHAAAIRLFGSFDKALRQSGIKPESVRLRRPKRPRKR